MTLTKPGLRTQVLVYPQWIGHVNIIVFTCYQGHPYRRSDDTFNWELAKPALSDRGHECLLIIIDYGCIGRSTTVR
jgi:hypothetical protein